MEKDFIARFCTRLQFNGLTLLSLMLLSNDLVLGQVHYGIAGQYPRDVGIRNNPAVVFAEDFEETSINDLLARWEYHNPNLGGTITFTPDKPGFSGGTKSLFMNGSYDLYRRLLPGYDTLYVRYYTKINSSCILIHHWPFLGGHNPSTAWPWPRAGQKPVGNERWSTAVEPHQDWRWDMYTYWKDMRPDGRGDHWGNVFTRGMNVPVNRGQWVCIEFMVKMNNPVTAKNGEQAFWIDGVKKYHAGQGFPMGSWTGGSFSTACTQCVPFEGFQWRTVPELNINYFWLEHFVDTDPGCGALFDDLVIAKSYIGPQVNQVTAPSIKNPFASNELDFRAYRAGTAGFVFQIPALPAGYYEFRVYDAKGRTVYSRGGQSSGKPQFVRGKIDHSCGVLTAVVRQAGQSIIWRFAAVR